MPLPADLADEEDARCLLRRSEQLNSYDSFILPGESTSGARQLADFAVLGSDPVRYATVFSDVQVRNVRGQAHNTASG
jgi:hypothetical protein